jgi:hypothetical protein
MKIAAQFVNMISGFFSLLLLLTPLTALAQTKVVVIPLFGDDAKPLKNIITVAKANGNFTDPVAAVNSITNASATNPYLVVIGPGVYTITQTLQMKSYVDIVGSGENVTKIKGAMSTDNLDASSAMISGVTNSTLSSLTVENTGGGYYSIGLFNSAASPRVSHATLTASGGSYVYGVYNYYYSSPTMSNVSVTASAGARNCGVYNDYYSSPTMSNVSATASGGTDSWGVRNYSSSPTMSNVSVRASAGSNNTGITNYYSSPAIRRSTIEGSSYSLFSDGAPASLSQSTLIGPVYGGISGTLNKCVACDNGSGTELPGNCGAP